MSLSKPWWNDKKKITTYYNKNYQKCPCSCLKKESKFDEKKIENNDEHENVPKI